MAVVCGFADTMVLDAKEGYAPSIAPSPFKRHGGLKILLLIKIKKIQINIKNFAETKKINYICSINKKGGNYENLKFLLKQRKKE